MRHVSLALLLTFGVLFIYAESVLPDRGSLEAPAAQHVAPWYVEHSYEHAHTPNVVTTILADYRGYDTLGETTVVLTAGLACMLILGMGRR